MSLEIFNIKVIKNIILDYKKLLEEVESCDSCKNTENYINNCKICNKKVCSSCCIEYIGDFENCIFCNEDCKKKYTDYESDYDLCSSCDEYIDNCTCGYCICEDCICDRNDIDI